MATKKEIMGNEMVDALNKGFKELHLPFKAKTAPDFRDPQKIKEVQIRSEIPHTSAVFVFEHKTNVSAAENLWNFSEQLHKEWQGAEEHRHAERQSLWRVSLSVRRCQRSLCQWRQGYL